MAESKTVMIAAGGTGGHVFPALAVADELNARDINVVWVGTELGMESTLVPARGFPLRKLGVSALRGKGLTARLTSAVRLLVSIGRSLRLITREQPGAVLGMGGYVAGPVCVAARLCNRRMVIHEQNAVPGMTNRLVKAFATRVLEAVPDTFTPSVGAVHTGNPVRRDILLLKSPEERMQSRIGPVRVLVIGGSQGAQTLNSILPAAAAMVSVELEIRHQAGKGKLEKTKQLYNDCKVDAAVTEFIDDMAEAYAWADIAICRAGAMTVAEVAAVGVASLLVPYPFAVDDHQTANGQFLVKSDAAVMLQESQLNAELLASHLQTLCQDRSRLIAMAVNARKVAKRNATELVVNELLGEAA